jgi:hypothetical protein
MTVTEDMQAAILKVPADSWTPAYDGDGQVRDGAWVADITGMLDLSSWPAGMRVIVRKERPHPGAQLRFTDIDGHRFTAFATDARKGQLADLELRHRRRARCEDRIRNAGSQANSCSESVNEVGLYGAGDGNRTRTISLGICAIRARHMPDLRGGLSVSDRKRPAFTGVNGTLMARRPLLEEEIDGLLEANGCCKPTCRTCPARCSPSPDDGSAR